MADIRTETFTYSEGGATLEGRIAYDAAKLGLTHVVWTQVSRQTDSVFPTNANTFYANDLDYYFVPDGSAAPIATREIANQDGCDGCHAKFKAETGIPVYKWDVSNYEACAAGKPGWAFLD